MTEESRYGEIVIWKYAVPLIELGQPFGHTIGIPAGGEFLKAAQQHGIGDSHLTFWFRVNSKSQPVERRFCVIPTGQPVPSSSVAEYVDTVLWDGGKFVWHVFELKGE